MKRLALIAALLAAPAAHAQNIGQASYIAPFPIRGQGTATVGTSSAAITSGLSLAPNSTAFPVAAPNSTVTLKVSGVAAQGVYVCWLGGTCTTSVGIYYAPGESVTKVLRQSMTEQPPTAIAAASTAITLEW